MTWPQTFTYLSAGEIDLQRLTSSVKTIGRYFLQGIAMRYYCSFLTILFSLLFFCGQTSASLPEFFGASSDTSARGNQFSLDPQNAANNYYNPSLLAFGKKTAFSFSTYFIKTNFEDITGIVVQNPVLGPDDTNTFSDNISTDYPLTAMAAIHVVFPFWSDEGNRIGLSLYTPYEFLTEANTGDKLRPEYVMYRARYRRLQIYLNWAYAFSSNWSMSIGLYTGLRILGNVNAILDNDSNTIGGSSANTKIQARPDISPLISFSWLLNNAVFYLSYQHKMKQKSIVDLSGQSTTPAIFHFDQEFNNALYFDPGIIRLGYSRKFGNLTGTGTLEYQVWDNYATPVTVIVNKGGQIDSSEPYESLRPKNRFVPKLAFDYNLNEKFTLSLGAIYRPSPLRNDLAGNGNSIDPDTTILTTGLSWKDIEVWGQKLKFHSSFQYHRLKSKTVTKLPGKEDSTSGQKIGAPGYKIGGNVLALSLGLSTDI